MFTLAGIHKKCQAVSCMNRLGLFPITTDYERGTTYRSSFSSPTRFVNSLARSGLGMNVSYRVLPLLKQKDTIWCTYVRTYAPLVLFHKHFLPRTLDKNKESISLYIKVVRSSAHKRFFWLCVNAMFVWAKKNNTGCSSSFVRFELILTFAAYICFSALPGDFFKY